MYLNQKDLWTLRAIIQKSGWKEFIAHVGSLMAEQVDKVARDSKQDKALFHFSLFFHEKEVQDIAGECGFFDYCKFIDIGFVPKEFEQLLLDNKPSAQEGA